MEEIIRILIKRFVSRGMEITSIPAYIRDLANSIVANPSMSLADLNGHLQMLGWDDFELDDYTLQLLRATFEPNLEYKPAHWFERTFNPKRIHKLTDGKEQVPVSWIEPNKPQKE